MNNDEKTKPLPCQITVQPVENGFVIQALNIKGTESERRLIAARIEDVQQHLRDLAGELYETADFEVRSRSDYTAATRKA